eukprot:Sspe_Gene.98391::Locus_71815_Transcript_1_1_Confidence_1.000_Length_833::g.98391::m.98391
MPHPLRSTGSEETVFTTRGSRSLVVVPSVTCHTAVRRVELVVADGPPSQRLVTPPPPEPAPALPTPALPPPSHTALPHHSSGHETTPVLQGSALPFPSHHHTSATPVLPGPAQPIHHTPAHDPAPVLPVSALPPPSHHTIAPHVPPPSTRETPSPLPSAVAPDLSTRSSGGSRPPSPSPPPPTPVAQHSQHFPPSPRRTSRQLCQQAEASRLLCEAEEAASSVVASIRAKQRSKQEENNRGPTAVDSRPVVTFDEFMQREGALPPAQQ